VGGIQKVTRHPSFIAFAIFGFAHMLMNGWAGDILFFGSFPALSILGGSIRTAASSMKSANLTGDSSRKPRVGLNSRHPFPVSWKAIPHNGKRFAPVIQIAG
jgi:uncharacterized membrane protein